MHTLPTRASPSSADGSSLLWDDGIIDPADTRKIVALALSASLNAPVGNSDAPVYRM